MLINKTIYTLIRMQDTNVLKRAIYLQEDSTVISTYSDFQPTNF